MDTQSLTRAVSRYLATFGRKPDTEIVAAYGMALRSLSDEQLVRAFRLAMEVGGAHPLSAAQLLELGRHGNRDDADAQALLAFEELERALDENRPSLMSPATAAVARSIGDFESLRTMPLAEFRTWRRRDFLAAYAELVRTRPERLTALAGMHSDIAVAFETLPSREETERIEQDNRERLLRIEE